MKSYLPIVFALMTGLFWGTYAPALAQARAFNEKSPFKPYIMIGIAYLVWAIIGGLAGMAYRKESFSFTASGTFWGFSAGTLGAWGALTLTLAIFNGGRPQIVMPIVFGTAVSVSAIVAVLMTKSEINPRLWFGIIGIVICIVIVAYYTPHAGPAHGAKPVDPPSAPDATVIKGSA